VEWAVVDRDRVPVVVRERGGAVAFRLGPATAFSFSAAGAGMVDRVRRATGRPFSFSSPLPLSASTFLFFGALVTSPRADRFFGSAIDLTGALVVAVSRATLLEAARFSKGMEDDDVVVDRAGLVGWARRAARVFWAAGGAFSSALRPATRRVCIRNAVGATSMG
jgi:hypothetical protein